MIPSKKVVTQKTDGENRQTAAAVNQTKDNHHLPAVNELSHLLGLGQALQGFSASSAPRLRDHVKDRSKSSCPSATQVQISTMPPGQETYMDYRFVFLYQVDVAEVRMIQRSFILVFGDIFSINKAFQIHNFWKLNLYVPFGAFGSYKVTVQEKFQKNPKKS